MFCKDSSVGELRDTEEVLSMRSLPSYFPKINITTNLTKYLLIKKFQFLILALCSA